MIAVQPGRVRPSARVETPSRKPADSVMRTFLAPVNGLDTNAPPASPVPGTAVVLDNFLPTATGIKPRGGTILRCTIAGAVQSLFQYRAAGASTYFAADATSIYEFSDGTASGTPLSASVTGQTSGDYYTLEQETAGGSYLTAVNAADYAQIYDGTSWQQVTDVSSPLAITGVSTDKLGFVWAHRNRTFFIEKNTMNAWYLATNSVAGAATKLPLSGVFNKGGVLLFGGTWSTDSGDGMDDKCVFVTNRGEFAIYSGGDPGSASDWSLNGVYDIGEPLGKGAVIRVGGDLIVTTSTGLIPLSAAVDKDPTQLKLSAISTPIAPDWQRETVLAGNNTAWRLTKWESRDLAVVTPPNANAEQGYCWAVNLETGRWSRISGWVIDAIADLGGNLHYGDSSGNIFQCDVGGLDNGAGFECRACLSFDDMDTPGQIKTAQMVRAVWRYRSVFGAKYSVAADYRPLFGAAPSAPASSATTVAEWDMSDWDTDYWGEGDTEHQISTRWTAVSGHGASLAPQVQVTSLQANKLDCELISLDLLYRNGGVSGE